MGHGQLMTVYNGSELYCENIYAQEGYYSDIPFENKHDSGVTEITITDGDENTCTCCDDECVCNCIENAFDYKCTNLQCIHYTTNYENECINLKCYYDVTYCVKNEKYLLWPRGHYDCLCIVNLFMMTEYYLKNYIISDILIIVLDYIVDDGFWPRKKDITDNPEYWNIINDDDDKVVTKLKDKIIKCKKFRKKYAKPTKSLY